MAYKVLGQVISTAPSTATSIVNLIKDPSFENLNITSAITTATSSLLYPMPGTSNYWQVQNDNTTSMYWRGSKWSSLTADSGNQSIMVSPSTNPGTNGNVRLYYGSVLGTTQSTVGDPNKMDRTLAAKIDRPNTTYYFGAKYYSSTATGLGTARVTVTVWDGAGNANNSANTSVTTLTAGSWQTLSGSINVSTNKYATMSLQFQGNTNWGVGEYVAWDSVWFSPDSTYTSTFPNPDGTTAITAPFNDNGVQYSGTLGASESVRSYPGTITDLYTVPAGSSAVVSTITVNNFATRYNTGNDYPSYTTSTPVRIAILPSGQTLAKKNFVVFDAPVNNNTTQTFTIGVTLAAGDKIQVSAPTNNVSFTAFGSEN